MRMELGGFALIAILICGMIAVFLLGKDKSMPVGPLASRDCKRWVAQANVPGAGYYKDGSRLTQTLPDSNLTVTLESAQSPLIRDFSFMKLSAAHIMAVTTHSFAKLNPSSTLTGSAALNEAQMRLNNLQYEGAWTIHYDEPSKPTLTAKVKDLGTASCKVEGCFFSMKENVQALPLDGQAEAITALKAQGYFTDKLQPLKEACVTLREPSFGADFEASIAKFQSSCELSNATDIAKISAAIEACQALETSILPAAAKY